MQTGVNTLQAFFQKQKKSEQNDPQNQCVDKNSDVPPVQTRSEPNLKNSEAKSSGDEQECQSLWNSEKPKFLAPKEAVTVVGCLPFIEDHQHVGAIPPRTSAEKYDTKRWLRNLRYRTGTGFLSASEEPIGLHTGGYVDFVRRIASEETLQNTQTKAKERAQACDLPACYESSELTAGVGPDIATWTEKYKPKRVEDFIGQSALHRSLRTWLKSWISLAKNQGSQADDDTIEHVVNRYMMAADTEAEVLGFYSEESQEEADEDMLAKGSPAFCIEGPVGSGKTALVYACASELNMNVVEVHPGQERNGRVLMELFKEATQSHNVRHGERKRMTAEKAAELDAAKEEEIRVKRQKLTEAAKKPKNPMMAAFLKKSKPTDDKEIGPRNAEPKPTTKPDRRSEQLAQETDMKIESSLDESITSEKQNDILGIGSPAGPAARSHSPTAQMDTGAHRGTIILLEEVDLLFEQDRGFWSAVNTLLETTKRPIVMTSNETFPGDMLKRPCLKGELAPPFPDAVQCMIQNVMAARRMRTCAHDIAMASNLLRSQIRPLLLTAQFWANTGEQNDSHLGLTERMSGLTNVGLRLDTLCSQITEDTMIQAYKLFDDCQLCMHDFLLEILAEPYQGALTEDTEKLGEVTQTLIDPLLEEHYVCMTNLPVRWPGPTKVIEDGPTGPITSSPEQDCLFEAMTEMLTSRAEMCRDSLTGDQAGDIWQEMYCEIPLTITAMAGARAMRTAANMEQYSECKHPEIYLGATQNVAKLEALKGFNHSMLRSASAAASPVNFGYDLSPCTAALGSDCGAMMRVMQTFDREMRLVDGAAHKKSLEMVMRRKRRRGRKRVGGPQDLDPPQTYLEAVEQGSAINLGYPMPVDQGRLPLETSLLSCRSFTSIASLPPASDDACPFTIANDAESASRTEISAFE
eukprot:Clim_evm47s215 gene=Clim_evmTU47s215